MDDAANDLVDFKLLVKDDGVYLEHAKWGLVNLGPYDAVCDALCLFLAQHDFGEVPPAAA